MNDEIEIKTARLVRMLESEKLGGVLLNAQHNFAWLTGGSSNGIDLSRENGAASLLVRADGKRFVFASNIEMPRMLAEELSADDFEPVEYSWQADKATANFLVEKVRSLSDSAVATDYSIEDKVAACRFQLTAGEGDRYRQLGHDASAAIGKVIAKLDQGETEIEIAEKMRHQLGLGDMTSVVTLVAADERIGQFRHPVPTANRWNKMLLFVTCAKRYGLIVSLSRMVSVGEPSDELKTKTEAAAYVNASLLDATRPGVTGASLYSAAQKAYATRGLADEINRHHQGGATGYRTRDWVAHPRSAETVQVNQAFAWNPSITGTKVEETCIAGESGVEIITASAEFPQITVTLNGREYSSAGILSM
jgi:antitoxin VapB